MIKFNKLMVKERNGRIVVEYLKQGKIGKIKSPFSKWIDCRVFEGGNFLINKHNHLEITGIEVFSMYPWDTEGYSEDHVKKLKEHWVVADGDITEGKMFRWFGKSVFTIKEKWYFSRSTSEVKVTFTAPFSLEEVTGNEITRHHW